MKGLLLKDFKLMKGQKLFFIIILSISVGIAAFSDNSSSVIFFFPFVLSLFTLSTISYDEFDNGNAFLFTLPISRTGYAIEKYCLALLFSSGALAFATLLAMVFGMFKKTASVSEIAMIAVVILPILIVIQAVMIPFQLKFGAEKGRIAIIGVSGLLFVIGIVAVKAAQMLGIDIVNVIDHLTMVSMGIMVTVLIVTAIILLLISGKISISIVKSKEF